MTLGRFLGGAAVLVLAWFVHGAYKMLSPSEHTSGAMVEECRRIFTVPGFEPGPADQVDKAWQSDHWMDSKLRCRMKTTPERVRAFRAAVLAADGSKRGDWKTAVRHTPADCKGDEYACPRFGEIGDKKMPEWWDTRSAPDAEWLDMTEEHPSGGNVHGVNFAASESGGFVFAERWRT